jgi:hypothetical protein
MFSLPHAFTHKSRSIQAQDMNPDMNVAYHHSQHHHHHHSVDDGKKERKRKEIAGKLGKEINDPTRRNESVTQLPAQFTAYLCHSIQWP